MVFLRYYFEGAEEHRIKLTPHGSSKAGCAIPYLRTYKSTVSKLKNNVGGNRSGLKRVVQEIEGKGEDSSTAILLDSYWGMRGK